MKIFLVGSKTLPFLNNHDEDYDILILKEDGDTDEAVEAKKAELRNQYQQQVDFPTKRSVFFEYFDHYMQSIEGGDIDRRNIFFDEKKILNACKSKLNFWEDYLQRCNKSFSEVTPPKNLYHVLINIYIFKNRSYDFTAKQIQNIQKCYDSECTEQLFNQMKSDIEELLANVEPNAYELIEQYKGYLINTDWIISKIQEIALTNPGDVDSLVSKYADIIQLRQEARQRINELEAEIASL